jgi:hypothetical protein
MEWFTKIVHSVHNSVGVILEASRKGFDTHDCVNGGGGGGGGGGEKTWGTSTAFYTKDIVDPRTQLRAHPSARIVARVLL